MFQPGFLNKEAKFGFNPIGTGRIIKSTKELNPVSGSVDNMTFLNRAETAAESKTRSRAEGNGLVGDLLIGSTKFLTPKKWGVHEKLHNTMDGVKSTVRDLDTKAASKLIGKKSDDSLWGKAMSVEDKRVVARANEGAPAGTPKELTEIYRRPSLLAVPQNAMKVGAPILGTMYVGEKLYPMDGEEQLASQEGDNQEKNGLSADYLAIQLDKEAAFQKVAQLEEELEKTASELLEIKAEKELFWRQSEKANMEKTAALEQKVQLEKELFEKTASYEEFRIRMTSRERTKSAVKLAEDLLESGIIKQADFNKKVDLLIDCDEGTFNLYSSMRKQAQSDEKGLESSAFFIDYRSKDEELADSRQMRGLSKRGQTIGEAARDLHK